jgi:hypothetical protein
LKRKRVRLIAFDPKLGYCPMDKSLDNYRSIVENVLTDYSKYPYAYGQIERQLVFDRTRDHFLLLSVGWDKRRVHGALIHIDLIDGY